MNCPRHTFLPCPPSTCATAASLRAERAEAERDEWRDLAGKLRAQEAQISGVLMDVDEYEPTAAWVAVERIRAVLASTSAPPSKGEP